MKVQVAFTIDHYMKKLLRNMSKENKLSMSFIVEQLIYFTQSPAFPKTKFCAILKGKAKDPKLRARTRYIHRKSYDNYPTKERVK